MMSGNLPTPETVAVRTYSRRALVAVVAGALASACGGAAQTGRAPAAGNASATAAAATGTAQSGPVSATTPAVRTNGPTRGAVAQLSGAPKPGPTGTSQTGGGIAVPATGQWMYALSGSHETPFTAGDQPYSSGATLTIDVASDQGVSPPEDDMTTQDAEDQGLQWLARVQWDGDGLHLVFTRVNVSGVATFDCTYVPQVRAVPFPLHAQQLSTQHWSSSQCTGTTDVQVTGQDTAEADGRSWQVWVVRRHTTYQMGSGLQGTRDETQWISPDLGMAVKADVTDNGQMNGQSFSLHQITVLQSHP